jgi:hypothetical protein
MSILDLMRGKNHPKIIEARKEKQKEFADQLAKAIKDTIGAVDCSEINNGMNDEEFCNKCVKIIEEPNNTHSVDFQLPGYNKFGGYTFKINIDLANKGNEIVLYNSSDRDIYWKIDYAKMAQGYICNLIEKYINVQIKVAKIKKND